MKIYTFRIFRALLLVAFADTVNAAILKISPSSVTRQMASEVEGNYSTTHLYLNEVAAESIPITIFFDPQTTNIETCEVFTNLNRRERAQLDANGDGIEDGIKPVDGSAIVAGNDNHYFKAYPMSLASGGYQLTLNVTKTGAYRLSARYRFIGNPTWFYYTGSFGDLCFRAHAVVVSPKAAREIQLYEVNPLSVIATGTLPSQRGTLADLALGVGGGPRFNLQYVRPFAKNKFRYSECVLQTDRMVSGRSIRSWSAATILSLRSLLCLVK